MTILTLLLIGTTVVPNLGVRQCDYRDPWTGTVVSTYTAKWMECTPKLSLGPQKEHLDE